MSTLVVKNLPEHLHEALKARSRRHHRSLNKEAVSILEQALRETTAAGPAQATPETPGTPLTMQELEAALQDDRYRRLDSLADVEAMMDDQSE